MAIPHDNGKYKFHNHDHELSLISCPFHDKKEQKEEEEYSDDDDDDLNLTTKSKLICDGCTTPIYQRRYHSSSKSCNYYLSCGECTYFLHWECFHLPHELPSHPLHQIDGHNLILKTPPKLDITHCDICGAYTNGLIYKCVECMFQVDMKCASLPDTIKHAAHPYHHLKLLRKEITRKRSYLNRLCSACGDHTCNRACYKCGICEFIVHSSCASLPAAVTNPVRDRHHPLPLTFHASLNRPGDFYCDVCEEEMNPRTWMYHCRSCDISFHPDCFPTASGEYRNIKFGQRFEVAAVHPHPVSYQLLTKKLRCDVCRERKEYGCFGFQCAEDKCYFFMCLEPCATNYLFRDASLFYDRLLWIHESCAPDTNMLKRCIDHPSHLHQLTMLWRPGRSCLSRCDACGTIERGNFYSCIDCQYAIHESCADLPFTADYSQLHHHPLSLAFQLPPEYIKFNFPCDICLKKFLPKYWVYHCAICRYVVHIKCAIKTSPTNVLKTSAGKGRVMVALDFNVLKTNATSSCVLNHAAEIA